jgi:hypothetical protein
MHSWNTTIKMDLAEIGCEGVDLTERLRTGSNNELFEHGTESSGS